MSAPARATARRARCADGHGTLTPLFFSDEPVDIARAKAICGRCALRAECLERALDRAEPWGVWGGELIDTGRVVVAKRPRGRPPKTARPPLVVDELLRTAARTGVDVEELVESIERLTSLVERLSERLDTLESTQR